MGHRETRKERERGKEGKEREHGEEEGGGEEISLHQLLNDGRKSRTMSNADKMCSSPDHSGLN